MTKEPSVRCWKNSLTIKNSEDRSGTTRAEKIKLERYSTTKEIVEQDGAVDAATRRHWPITLDFKSTHKERSMLDTPRMLTNFMEPREKLTDDAI